MSCPPPPSQPIVDKRFVTYSRNDRKANGRSEWKSSLTYAVFVYAGQYNEKFSSRRLNTPRLVNSTDINVHSIT